MGNPCSKFITRVQQSLISKNFFVRQRRFQASIRDLHAWIEKNKEEMNSAAFEMVDSDIYTNSNHDSNGKEGSKGRKIERNF